MIDEKSVVFYESYFTGAKHLPPLERLEVYEAVMNYAFYGTPPDERISPVALACFNYARPLIEENQAIVEHVQAISAARRAAGRKGGRPRKTPPPEPEPAPVLQVSATPPVAPITIEDAVSRMRADTAWIDIVCKNRGLYRSNIDYLLTRFLAHYQETRHGIPHNSYGDARQHFLNWLNIQQNQTPHAKQTTQHNSSTPEQRNAAFASHIAERLTLPEPEIDISGNY